MQSISTSSIRRLVIVPVIGLAVAACGSGAPSSQAATPANTAIPGSSAVAASPSAPPAAEPSPRDAAATEPPGGTTSGDVPDNAVFLTYKGANPGFSIQYVEGWQVTPKGDGVIIKDKDSSETVVVVAAPPDVSAFVAATDLPALQAPVLSDWEWCAHHCPRQTRLLDIVVRRGRSWRLALTGRGEDGSDGLARGW